MCCLPKCYGCGTKVNTTVLKNIYYLGDKKKKVVEKSVTGELPVNSGVNPVVPTAVEPYKKCVVRLFL